MPPNKTAITIATREISKCSHNRFKKKAFFSIKTNHILCNTLLRTNIFALSTLNTCICNKKPVFFCLCTSEHKTFSDNRLFSQVKKLNRTILNAERFEYISALIRINGVHGRIFLKNPVNPLSVFFQFFSLTV